MKKVYVTPEIEYDDFFLDEVVCANLYGSRSGGSPEFYSIGSGYGSGSSTLDPLPPENGGESGDDLFG